MSEINITAFKRQSSRKKKKYTTFLKGLHSRKIKRLNALARKLNEEAFQKTDCLQCANCCKTMTPTWKPADIKRVSSHFKMTPAQFKEKYLYKDETGDWLNTKTPCFFLDKNNMCTIYEIRPKDCSGFPHIQSSDFLVAKSVNTDNMTSCPAVFRVIENMYKIVVEKDSSVLDQN